jgi:transposase
MFSPPQAPRPGTSRPRFATPPWAHRDPQRQELEQRLPPDHLARRIDQAVNRLDLTDLHAAYAGTGSPPYPPGLLLRAVLYEVQRGQHSPAAWHRDAHESGPLRWLLRGCTPSRSGWYAFRDRLGPQLDELNRQVLHQVVAQELTPATHGALDGTPVAANASRRTLLNAAQLAERVTQLDSWEAAGGDRARPAWMAPTPTGQRRQLRRLRRAQRRLTELQARNHARKRSKQRAPARMRVSPSDPEAALGKDKEGLFRPLYNVQLVDDLDSPFILAYEVLDQPNDAGAVGPLLARLRELVGHRLEILLADTAYTGGPDLAAAELAGATLYGPLPKDGGRAEKQIPKSAFTWLPGEKVYVCPQGHRLVYTGSARNKRSGAGSTVLHSYRCPPEHCAGCPLASRCTPRPDKGRSVSRSEYEELVEALRARMVSAAGKALYRQRCQTVELVNADWKEHRKLRRLSGRGLARVRCQVGVMVLAHNLLTLLAEEEKPEAAKVAATKLQEVIT